jgi:hypothetical protein
MTHSDLQLNPDEPLAYAVFGPGLRLREGDEADYMLFTEKYDAERCVDETATEEGGEDRVIVPLYPRMTRAHKLCVAHKRRKL